ncbi:hypothetical protein V6Z11_A07G124000 [Gossypium hirsutum]
MNSLCDITDPGESTVEEMIPKKVRFKDKKDGMSNDMVVEMISDQPTSWRDMLVGHSSNDGFNNSGEKDTIDIVEGDIQKSVVNGVPSITFSDRIHQIFIQEQDLQHVETLNPYSHDGHLKMATFWSNFRIN